MQLKDIKITIHPSKLDSKTAAYVNLEFPVEIEGVESSIVVTNFRLMTNKYGGSYNFLPPSIYGTGRKKYIEIFFLKDKGLWYQLRDMVVQKFEDMTDAAISDLKADVF